MVCVVGRMRDLILQLSKSSIYSTKPRPVLSLSAGENKLNNMSCIVGQLFFPETFKKFKFCSVLLWGIKFQYRMYY
ncbi:hypothetical protein ED267_23810 [Escherichia coli]|nr:hypothetical protein [Escherichia coli]